MNNNINSTLWTENSSTPLLVVPSDEASNVLASNEYLGDVLTKNSGLKDNSFTSGWQNPKGATWIGSLHFGYDYGTGAFDSPEHNTQCKNINIMNAQPFLTKLGSYSELQNALDYSANYGSYNTSSSALQLRDSKIITNFNFSRVCCKPTFTLWNGFSTNDYGVPTQTITCNASELGDNVSNYPYCIKVSNDVYYNVGTEEEPSYSMLNCGIGMFYSSDASEVNHAMTYTNKPYGYSNYTEITTMVRLWVETREPEAPDPSIPIPDELIQKYFRIDYAPLGVTRSITGLSHLLNGVNMDYGSVSFDYSGLSSMWFRFPEVLPKVGGNIVLTTAYAERYAGLHGFYYTRNDDFSNIAINDRTEDGCILLDTCLNPLLNPWLYPDGVPRSFDTSSNPESGGGDSDIVDDNKYVDDIGLNDPSITPYGAFTNMYLMSKGMLTEFADEIFTADESKQEQLAKGLALMGANPINSVVSMRMYPLDLSKYINSINWRLGMGGTTLDSTGNKVIGNPSISLNVGSFSVPRHFNNYLDYEETKLSIYLPYIGTFPLDPKQVVNKTLKVRYSIDLFTGTCIANVKAGGIPVLTQQGVIGVNVAVTGSDASAYASQVYNATFNQASNMLQTASNYGNAIAQASMGNVGGAINGLVSGFQSELNTIQSGFNKKMLTNSSQPIVSGSTSPMLGFYQPQYCYLIFDYPILENPSNYGSTEGYTYMKTGKLKGFKGYTTVINPHINIDDINPDELTELETLLQSGVII